jgi:hypothetical protein
MPCKYGCSCPKCPKGSDELFKSPIAYGSKLGKYTGTINRKTALERQGYAMTTRFQNAINDKQGLINFIQRRELLRGPSNNYSMQIDQLRKEIDEIKAKQKETEDRNAKVTEVITNNAGKMVPASVLAMANQVPPNKPVKAESTQTEETGIVGDAPQPTAGGGSSAPAPETPAPEAPAPEAPAPEAPAPEAPAPEAPAPAPEAPAPEAPEEAPSESEEAPSESEEEDPEVRDKRLGVYAIMLSERKPGESKNAILRRVMELDEDELDEFIGNYYPQDVEELKAVIPESALQRFEMAFTGQR